MSLLKIVIQKQEDNYYAGIGINWMAAIRTPFEVVTLHGYSTKYNIKKDVAIYVIGIFLRAGLKRLNLQNILLIIIIMILLLK